MKRSFHRAMLGLHTWAGFTLGWVSFLIFLTGTLAYFQPEITQWMQPGLKHSRSTAHAVENAVARLRIAAPDATDWTIGLPSDRDPSLGVSWRASESGTPAGRALLNAATGEPVTPVETLGGRLFYSFHFTLMMPGVGYWITGAAAMFMLVALVTGVIVHKKVFIDFFAFRPRSSPRRAWLDVHNLSSVLALPFHVVIVYTGLVTLVYSYMPSILQSAYPDNGRGFFREAFAGRDEQPRPDKLEVPLRDLGGRIRQLEAAGVPVVDLRVARPSAPDASVVLGLAREPSSTFVVERNVSGVANLHDSLYELHLGRFAGWGVRWLLFVSGIAGSAMIATGLLIWSLKRRERVANAGGRIGCFVADRLNVAVINGVLLAAAAYFLANRLLPAALEERGLWELRCFYWGWAAAALHAFVRPARDAWREQLWLTACAFAALPLVSGLTTGRHIVASVADEDWVFAAFDGVALLTAVLTAFAARRLPRTKGGAVPAENRDAELASGVVT